MSGDRTLDVDVEGIRQLGAGLGDLAGALGDTLRAVDAVPVDAVAPVLGPVGADFMSALIAATARHRRVLAAVAQVVERNSELAVNAALGYEQTDAGTAAGIARAGDGSGEVRL